MKLSTYFSLAVWRAMEEQAFVHFTDFLDSCECNVKELLHHRAFSGWYCMFLQKEMHHVPWRMSWCSSLVPPGSLPLAFIHHQHWSLFMIYTGAKLATSSTCDLVLRIPTRFGADEFSEFTEWMAMSVLGNDGFGGV